MCGESAFSTLEIIFCVFFAENYFVKVLIQLAGLGVKRQTNEQKRVWIKVWIKL